MPDINMNELAAEMKEGLEGVSVGPWDHDELKNDGDYGSGPDCNSGFDSYALYDVNGKIIADTLNNDVAEVHEDWPDEDGYAHAWDEQAKKDINHIARCDPANIRAILTEREALIEALSGLLKACDYYTGKSDFTLTEIIENWGDQITIARSILKSAKGE